MNDHGSHNGSALHGYSTTSSMEGPPTRPTYLNTSNTPSHSSQEYTRVNQMNRVLETIRSRDMKIAVICDERSKNHAQERFRKTAIATELNRVLCNSKALVYEFTITSSRGPWLSYLTGQDITHFIFVGLPHSAHYISDKSPEKEFFNSKSTRILNCVVVREKGWSLEPPITTRRTIYTPSHYLEKFMQLEGCDQDVVSMALSHFSLGSPVPHPSDKAYWSELPKVIQVPKNQRSLGLSILTREMAQKSMYPRVVLIKSFNPDCSEALKRVLGRYTHIQSYNGVLLDGLNINDVSSIIQSSAHLKKIQLVVRYIHPIITATSTKGLGDGQMGTPITPGQEPLDTQETLPVHLMILGDVLKQCKELFRHLSMPPTDIFYRSSTSSSSSSSSQQPLRSKSAPSVETMSTATPTNSTPTNSTPSKTSSDPFYLRIPHQTSRSETSGSGCESYTSSEFNDYLALARSDSYVSRDFVPSFLFNSFSTIGGSGGSGGSGGGGGGGGNSAGSGSTLPSPCTVPARPPNADKQYIVSMFTREMDRRCVHLFLRQCAVYIITFSFSAMFDDPQIQFENLLYWIRLVQGYVPPNGIKRIIVVGMKDISLNTGEEQQSLEHLKGAIRDADFQNLYMTRQKNPIVLFDPNDLYQSLGDLTGAITRCMELMVSRAWHMDKPFYSSVFQPFSFLNQVLCYLSESDHITMSADDMLTVYKNSDPNFFDTLAAYSTASISLTQNLDSLLKTEFLIELLKKLNLETETYKDAFTHDIPMVKGLPVVLNPWPKAQITAINNHLTLHQQDSIMQWAEKYELMFSLGYFRNYQVYFIPLLATEFQTDETTWDWPEGDDEDQWYSQESAIVLYAQLNFCAIHHFFYLLIKEALKDVVDSSHQFRSMSKCYIKLGCMEAIVPVQVPEAGQDIMVYMKYHILQNTVEFRTECLNKQLYLYYAANRILKASFNQSRHRHIPGGFTKAITFCLPAESYPSSLVESHLGKLCRLNPDRSSLSCSRDGTPALGDEDYSLDHDLLLKMVHVTPSKLKEWTLCNVDSKNKVPEECYHSWGRRLSSNEGKWALVGSKLNLLKKPDIDFYRTNPCRDGNGRLVLSKWSSSATLTYKDLTEALRWAQMDALADEIDSYFAATEV